MSKLPAITGKQALAAFQRAGFVVDRTTGSHQIMKKEGHAILVSVPVHAAKTIGRGLLARLIKDAGLSREEFRNNLR